ncbi:MAG: carbohydrate-binding family 6 protein [Planctomycetes bacterium]|nr:carbohydrate-binding family 6 protein [Planctomycetota bacterium]
MLRIAFLALLAAPGVSVRIPDSCPQAEFAAAEIRGALGSDEGEFTVSLEIDAANLVPQGYAIRTGAGEIRVRGGDANGLLYGGLELAERIRTERILEKVGDADGKPFIEKRGIKFNIPLDLRTPSYSDSSDAAQRNIPEMWSMAFWRGFLDGMARHRFNVLTLWSLHPFPSLVKVPEFPDVALDDVWRTRVPLDDSFSHSGSDMVRPEMLGRVEVVKRITIDEKMRFWREVMRHARDRGIEVYIFTWNIFTWGATGKHGITPSQTNETTIAYFRASVREMVLAYPDLAGFGITAGERMEDRKDEYAKETWLWRTYGEGIRDAKKIRPDRSVRLIHRFHQTGQGDILRAWKDYPDTFEFSFKYAIAHMYSVPDPPFIRPALASFAPGKRTWLTVRNDDIYSFRWGDPAFARAFLRAMPGSDKVVGFYMGPDGYCWGRDFLSRDAGAPPPLVLEKQWYSFMLWGRLAYNPEIPDALFVRALARRFPGVPAETLFEAWASASKIFPQITRFFWGDIDLRWFPEACLSSPRHKGFYTVRHFIEGRTMPESGILDILQWRERLLAGKAMDALTPLDVAAALRGHAASALARLDALRPAAAAGKELRLTIGDIEAFAHIGNYYAEKILGAADLALFDASGDVEKKASAIAHLEAALGHWRKYAAVYGRQYRPALFNRVGFVDIPALAAKVQADVDTAREWKQGTIRRRGGGGAGDRPFRP